MRGLTTVLLLLALAGCATPATENRTGKVEYSAQELYEIKCAKCHKFYHPADYSQQDWDMWMRKMSKKAKLNPAQKDLLSQYLATFRGAQPSHRPP